MRPWQRVLLALVLACSLILPPLFAPKTPPGTIAVPREAPALLAQALEGASGRELLSIDHRRILEKTLAEDTAILIDAPTLESLRASGPALRFEPLALTRPVVLTLGQCDASSTERLAASPCRIGIAHGDRGLSLAALVSLLAPPGADPGDSETALEVLRDFAAREAPTDMGGYSDLEKLLAPGVRDAILILPLEWALLLRRDHPESTWAEIPGPRRTCLIGVASRKESALDRAALASALPEAAEALDEAGALGGPAPGGSTALDAQPFRVEELHAADAAAEAFAADRPTTRSSPLSSGHVLYTLALLGVIAWGASLYWRVAVPRLRGLLVLQSVLLAQYALLRLLRLSAPAEAEVVVWILYYVPLLTMPTAMLAFAVEADETIAVPLRRRVEWVSIIVSLAFLVLVSTTTLHGLVFDFPDGFSRGDPYTIGVGRTLIFGWIIAESLLAWVLLVRIARRGGGRAALGIEFVLLVVLSVLTPGERWSTQARDIESALILIIAVVTFCEITVRTGFIPTARKYREGFVHFGLPARIEDSDGCVLARTRSLEALADAPRRSVSEGALAVPGGRLVWEIDVSELESLRERLSATRARLVRSREMIARQADIEGLEGELAHRNRVLNAYDRLSEPALARINALGEELPTTPNARRAQILRLLAVDLAYVKYTGALLLGSSYTNGNPHSDEDWNRAADLLRALSRFIAAASTQTHLAALVPLASPDEAMIPADEGLRALRILREVLIEHAEHDGAELLVHFAEQDGRGELTALLEAIGDIDAEIADRLLALDPDCGIDIEGEALHLRFAFGCARTGGEAC
ncbi:hypothetical protein [Schaalia hyovaginalis]|uniref:hypothetical protein n=1 Tax=Schaalia hyovaginalis TaxID=29316 RepID=UPI0026E9E271|nr:hypothetical protein [Schaalia hyovaginalis]MCI6411603.1 hypothetical protein [Schaalia hyovaginalis]